jgi:nucleoside-diphosphate-sugar epimerase
VDGPVRSVLVTGSSGFIGHHLTRALAGRGYAVTGWDILPPRAVESGVRHETVDLLDGARVRAALAALRPDAVLHLAARTDLHGRTVADYPANVAGVENLTAAIRATQSVGRAICTSSQLVCRVGYHPQNEHDYAPSTPYGESKVRTECIWRETIGSLVSWCLVRPTTIWGPGMNPHYLRFFRMIRDGRYVHVGNDTTLKSYGYVGNTVYQYVRLLEAPEEVIARRLFFLADYELLPLQGWAEAFRSALQAPPIRTIPLWAARAAARVGDGLNTVGLTRFPFNSFRLNNVLTEYRADLAATKEVCGDLPFSMADGVAETASWLRGVLRAP